MHVSGDDQLIYSDRGTIMEVKKLIFKYVDVKRSRIKLARYCDPINVNTDNYSQFISKVIFKK